MKGESFELISGILKQRSGLALNPNKAYLLESRLMPIARRLGLADLDSLADEMRQKRNDPLMRDVTEAMTTNESFIFRDNTPFTLLREEVLPLLTAARASTRTLRIWCAACSTGQEPYSIAMILKEESAGLDDWCTEIVATDISMAVLEKAKSGIYSQFEVQRGLPIQMLLKYFNQTNELWQIDSSIRAMVKYRELNLLEDISSLCAFDIVFCRNVLIYFDKDTKATVLRSINGLMPKDGVLFLGGAETVLGVSDNFKPVTGWRGAYRPAEQTSQ